MNAHRITWLLRIAVAAEFAGHGAFALLGKSSWVPFITLWGISVEAALPIMRVVGTLDLVLAAIVLVRPIRGVVVWMIFWGLFTALLRPLSGGEWLDFVERGANWGAPLALLWLLGWPRRWRDLLR